MSGLADLRYSIWDPTGNVTALVESEVPVADQPVVASELMRDHPEVEQVGFVRLDVPELRMAGGEFCGNATLSTAALCLLTRDVPFGEHRLHIGVSGAERPVDVCLSRVGEALFEGSILMPEAISIEWEAGRPLVRMPGISHIVVEQSSPHWHLVDERSEAECVVRTWCEELQVDGLGLMFLGDGEGERALTPLVYVPAADTCFWESSCASGSAAVGMYLAAKAGQAVNVTLREPGGTLRVKSDPTTGETWLHGRARLLSEMDR